MVTMIGFLASAPAGGAEGPAPRTTLRVDGTRFTLDGKPTFLLGISDYAALGAPEEFLREDLTDFQRHGFNWLRVWATCGFFDQDISAVDALGRPREPHLTRLRWIVAECDRRGLVVDVTLTRDRTGSGAGLRDLEAHRRAVETLVVALREHRNWYLDLANERDVRDARFVPAAELKILRDLVRRLDPARLVTASLGGHDIGPGDLEECLSVAGLDFLAPHRPREAGSPAQTAARTVECLAMMEQAGRSVPILYQEPFRRGYGPWQPSAEDFLIDLRGARSGGAAGWCFHNGSQREAPEERPRRSFDLRRRRLIDQLDEVERDVLERARRELQGPPAPERPGRPRLPSADGPRRRDSTGER